MTSLKLVSLVAALAFALSGVARAEDPATEPAVQAVNKVWPAVVNINTERILRQTVRDPYDALFNQFFGGPMRPPREFRQKVQSLGSGFIVDPAGFIVTNEHVVERAADLKIQVTMSDGKTYNAKYVYGDPSADIAYIKIESKTPLPFISLSDLSPNLLGQTVLALGNPLGYGISVSRGILSALNRTITIDENEYKDLIQTDAAINPGNSGGPLIDLSGKLIGVSSVKMAYTPQGVPTQGLGFGIPAATVRDKVRGFTRAAPNGEPVAKANGEKSAAERLFGIQLQDLTADLSDALGYQQSSGVLISNVEPGSPAAKAGLKRGLVVYKVGPHPIAAAGDLENLLDRAKAGTVADFSVGVVQQRGGQKFVQIQTVSVAAR
jgi:serine protease Do